MFVYNSREEDKDENDVDQAGSHWQEPLDRELDSLSCQSDPFRVDRKDNSANYYWFDSSH